MIPKIIHYCWFGKSPKPDYFHECYKSWQKYLPDYQIIEWNEKTYDIKKYIYTDIMYKYNEYAFVSDVARLDILLEYGGIYLDIDVLLCNNLDDLLSNKAFCCYESRDVEYFGNAILGSEPNSKFIKKVHRNTLSKFSNGTHHIKLHDGIDTLRDALITEGLVFENKLQCLPNVTMYPFPYFSVSSKTEGTKYGIHLNKHNWGPKDSYITYVVISDNIPQTETLSLYSEEYNFEITPTCERLSTIIPTIRVYFLPTTKIIVHFVHSKMNLQTIVRKLGLTDYIITKLKDNKIYI